MIVVAAPLVVMVVLHPTCNDINSHLQRLRLHAPSTYSKYANLSGGGKNVALHRYCSSTGTIHAATARVISIAGSPASAESVLTFIPLCAMCLRACLRACSAATAASHPRTLLTTSARRQHRMPVGLC